MDKIKCGDCKHWLSTFLIFGACNRTWFTRFIWGSGAKWGSCKHAIKNNPVEAE